MSSISCRHYLKVPCPNCRTLLAIPVRIGLVSISPKAIDLCGLEAKVAHQCPQGEEQPTEENTDV